VYEFEDFEKGGVCVDSEPGLFGGGPRLDVAKCGGFDFLFFVFNSVFILRLLRFMIALVKTLSKQKKTVSGLLMRTAVLGFGESFYCVLAFQESSFCYPQSLVSLYHNGDQMSTAY